MWSPCPDAHALSAYVEGKLDEPARAAMTRHLADCDRCLESVALAARLQGGDAPVVPPLLLARARELGRGSVRSPLVRWAPALASAAVILLAAFVYLQPRTAPSTGDGVAPAERPRDVRSGDEIAAGPVITAPVEEGVLSGSPVRVEWSPVAGAVLYDIRIAAEDGALVWDGRAAAGATAIVAEAQLQTGHRYYVTVTAQGAGDRRVRSRAVGFQIERRAP